KVATADGVRLAHVKPHGALYNLAAVDDAIAAAVAAAVARAAPGASLVGLAGSRSLVAARAAGLDAVAEGFADRAYLGDGTRAPRDHPGALLAEPQAAAQHALRLVVEGRVATLDGGSLELQVDTLCLHGDAPGAAARARAVRAALEAAAVVVAARAAPA